MPDLNQRLEEAVRARRSERGWSQADVYANGGPSDTTQGKVESGRGSVGGKTLAQLDTGLEWEPGTAARILATANTRLRHPMYGTHLADLEAWAGSGDKSDPPPGILGWFSDDDLLEEVGRRMRGGSSDGWSPKAEKMTQQDVGLAARRGQNRGAAIRDDDGDEPA